MLDSDSNWIFLRGKNNSLKKISNPIELQLKVIYIFHGLIKIKVGLKLVFLQMSLILKNLKKTLKI